MQACLFIKQQYDRHLKSGNCDEVWALKVANFDFTCDKKKRVGDLFTFITKKVTKGRKLNLLRRFSTHRSTGVVTTSICGH